MYEHENISECVEKIADYEEDSIPVLTQDGKIAGILTATDIVELVDDAMGDDYAKLAGLTSEEDLKVRLSQTATFFFYIFVHRIFYFVLRYRNCP